jgi:hypothetical protein
MALPRLDLSKQSKVKTTDPQQWLSNTFEQVISAWEKKLPARGIDPPSKGFRTLRHYLYRIVHQLMTIIIQPDSPYVFVFAYNNMQTSDVLFIGNCVRHTREYGSLVLDGWIIPITFSRQEMLYNTATVFTTRTKRKRLPLTTELGKLVRQFMPSAVESCRRGWKHTSMCAYLANGRAPISTEDWQSPICSCGEGKDTEEFPSESFVGNFKSIATRVAIPLLSAVSYVEPMGPERTYL